jgi:hypothetical protein
MTTVALRREGLSSSTLKWIALCCMVFDHVAEFFPMQAPLWFHWIGRLAEPIFLFCAAWSVVYTHSRKQFLLRLYLGNVAMGVIQFFTGMDNNVLRVILVACAFLSIVECRREGNPRWKAYLAVFLVWQVASTVLFAWLANSPDVAGATDSRIWTPLLPAVLGSAFNAEGGFFFIFLCIAFYWLKDSRKRLILGFVLFSIALFILDVTPLVPRAGSFLMRRVAVPLGWDLWFRIFYDEAAALFGFPPQAVGGFQILQSYRWMIIFALPFLLVYNGRRGRGGKYFFYIFYPAHLLFLYLLSYATGELVNVWFGS